MFYTLSQRNKKIANLNVIQELYDFFLFFCLTFSGDYAINGFPIFFIFWVLILFRRRCRISKYEIYTQITLLFIFLPVFSFFENYSDIYFISAFYPALYVNGLILFKRQISNFKFQAQNNPSYLLWIFGVSIGGLFLLGLLNGWSGDRNSIVFGPNVYYRIVGYLFFCQLVIFKESFSRNYKFSYLKFSSSLAAIVLIFFCTLFLLLETGSRGAAVVSIAVLIATVLCFWGIRGKPRNLILIFFMPAVSGLCILYWPVISILFTRVIRSRTFTFYDPDTASTAIASRSGYLSSLPDFFENGNFLFGNGTFHVNYYPHNIYLESLYNTGLFNFIPLLLFSIFLLFSIVRGNICKDWISTIISLIPVFIGAFFSGTIYDNYSMIALILSASIMGRRKISKRYKPFVEHI